MLVIPALIGAGIYAALHEWFSWLLNKAEKQRTCHHDYSKTTSYMGYKTRHCSRCGHQEHVPKEDDT